MKKYVKNKNFIPRGFVEKLDILSDEKNNKLILVLIIINIFIIPNSISKISTVLKNNEVVPVVSINETNKNSNNEKLILLLNSIDNTMNNVKIQNNSGFIEIDSIEKLYNIEEKKSFEIKSVVMEENIIVVEVGL